jgi:hypothetical protein
VPLLRAVSDCATTVRVGKHLDRFARRRRARTRQGWPLAHNHRRQDAGIDPVPLCIKSSQTLKRRSRGRSGPPPARNLAAGRQQTCRPRRGQASPPLLGGRRWYPRSAMLLANSLRCRGRRYWASDWTLRLRRAAARAPGVSHAQSLEFAPGRHASPFADLTRVPDESRADVDTRSTNGPCRNA